MILFYILLKKIILSFIIPLKGIPSHDKKTYKESKIVKKCLGRINLLVVSRGKCNNGIKRENSTGSLSIINRAYLI